MQGVAKSTTSPCGAVSFRQSVENGRRGVFGWVRRTHACFILAFALSLAPGIALADSPFDKLFSLFGGAGDYENIVSSNGRIEAQSVSVATKYAGRLTEIDVHEGDEVAAGAVIARLDERDTRAELLRAQASVASAEAAKAEAVANMMQARSALDMAETSFARVTKLHEDGHASDASLDDITNVHASAEATLAMAEAKMQSADAQISASKAGLAQIENILDDLTIRAPIAGRVLFRLHEPGEVLAAGASVVTLLDLTEVHMNVYFPAPVVGMLSINDEARLILDPIPDYVIPARISFISPDSQFTPKSVETRTEREELVFRVKLTIPRDLLEQFETYVKSGIRGRGFVKTRPDIDWPDALRVTIPD